MRTNATDLLVEASDKQVGLITPRERVMPPNRMCKVHVGQVLHHPRRKDLLALSAGRTALRGLGQLWWMSVSMSTKLLCALMRERHERKRQING